MKSCPVPCGLYPVDTGNVASSRRDQNYLQTLLNVPGGGGVARKPPPVENRHSKSYHLSLSGSYLEPANPQSMLLAWGRARADVGAQPRFQQAPLATPSSALVSPLSSCFEFLIMESASSTGLQCVRTSQLSQDMKRWPQSRLKRKLRVGMALPSVAGS